MPRLPPPDPFAPALVLVVLLLDRSPVVFKRFARMLPCSPVRGLRLFQERVEALPLAGQFLVVLLKRGQNSNMPASTERCRPCATRASRAFFTSDWYSPVMVLSHVMIKKPYELPK